MTIRRNIVRNSILQPFPLQKPYPLRPQPSLKAKPEIPKPHAKHSLQPQTPKALQPYNSTKQLLEARHGLGFRGLEVKGLGCVL